MNRKGEVPIGKAIGFFIVFIVVLALGIIVIQQVGSTARTIETTTLNASQDFLGQNSTTFSLTQSFSSLVNTITNQFTWLKFDGDADVVRGVYSQEVSQNRTYSVWLNASGATGYGSILQIAEDVEYLVIDESGNLIYAVVNDSDDQFNTTYFGINNSDWTHVAVLINQTTESGYGVWTSLLYVDGILVNQTNITGAGKSVSGIVNVSDAENSFNGSIDEVRIYNRSLLPSEIVEINNSDRRANSSLTSDGLRVWYSLNENSGTTAHDIGRNDANNGTISGASYANDNTNNSLTRNADYTNDADEFTISNADYSWDAITFTYRYENVATSAAGTITRVIGIFVALIFIVLLIGYIKENDSFMGGT